MLRNPLRRLLPGVLLLSCTLIFTNAGAAPAQVEDHVDRWYSHRDGDPGRLPNKHVGNEVVYQIFLDRFANGNTANDCLYDGRFCDPSHNDWYRFWGGDIRGLINQLDYLKGMGVTRIWITPIFDNQLVKVSRVRHGQNVEVTAYHGYWPRDWFRLNPMFSDHGKEDYAIVDELVRRAGPEMRLLLDTVTNHSSPADARGDSLDYLNWIEPLKQDDGLRRTHRGAVFRKGEFFTSLDLDEQIGGSQPAFHHFGSIQNYEDQYQLENFQLDALSDLDQDNATVRRYMRDAHDFWIDRFPGLAGYRMDTVKHVPLSYWKQFDRDFFGAHPHHEVIAEYFGAGPSNPGAAQFYRESQQTMFDFEFRQAIQDVFIADKPMKTLTRVWAADPALIDARSMVTFVDNHDLARARGRGMSFDAMRQSLALIFFARGIPSVYYGLEQDLFHGGDPGDPYNRPMMRSFDRNAPLYQVVQKLSALRKANPALRWGSTHVVHESDQILGFERVDGEHRAFFATSKNKIDGVDEFDMQRLTFPDGDYIDALSGETYPIRGGKLHVKLKRGGIIALSSTLRR
jgi:cyclomaltodextrin glucanotransferase